MARPKTTKTENHYFEQFLRHYPLPSGHVSYGGPNDDKPDLVVRENRCGKIVLGIEQTRFYIESGRSTSSEQIQSKWRAEVLEKAESEYKRNNSKGLRLSISFNKESPIRSVDEVVAKIGFLSAELKPTDLGRLPAARFASIPEVEFVYVQWDLGVPWQLTQVYSGQLTSKERLQAIVKKKDRQAAGYRSCAELWLLVVIDFFDRAQDQHIDDNISVVQSDRFSKVILFKTVFNEITEVSCVKD